jgi:hypothetical protein
MVKHRLASGIKAPRIHRIVLSYPRKSSIPKKFSGPVATLIHSTGAISGNRMRFLGLLIFLGSFVYFTKTFLFFFFYFILIQNISVIICNYTVSMLSLNPNFNVNVFIGKHCYNIL